MSKKKTIKTNHPADPILANPHPTAVSPEFIPKTTPDPAAPFSNRSDAVFDILPEIKAEKYK